MFLLNNRFRLNKIILHFRKLQFRSFYKFTIILFTKVSFSSVSNIVSSKLSTSIMSNRNDSNELSLPTSTKDNLFLFCSGFQPIQTPQSLRNATVLDRSLFSQRVSVPALKVSPAKIEEVQALLKSSGLLLRRPKLKPLIEVPFIEPFSRDNKSCSEHNTLMPTDDVFTSANLNPNQDSLQPSRKRPRPQPVSQSDRLLLLDSACLKDFLLTAYDGNTSSDVTRQKTLRILLERKRFFIFSVKDCYNFFYYR